MSQGDPQASQQPHQYSQPGDNHGSATSNCDAILELIPAYALGATTPDEYAFVQAHLAECPDALAELAEYRELTEALHYSAPLVQVPPYLGDRIRDAINQPQTVVSRPTPLVRARRALSGWHWTRTAAAAAILILLAANAFWIVQNNDLRNQQQQLAHNMAQQNSVLALIAAGNVRRVEFPVTADPTSNQPYAAMLCDPEQNAGILYVKNFPAVTPDKVYQLWMRQNGQPISMGLLWINHDGTGTMTFVAPMPIKSYETMGITLEPASGSPQPTGKPILRGSLTY